MSTVKIVMAVVLVVLEVPAAFFLIYSWIRARGEYMRIPKEGAVPEEG